MRGQIVRSWTKFILAECLLVAFVLAFCFFGITPVDHPYISKLPFSLSLFRPQTSRPAISSPFPRFYVSLPHEGVVWRRGGQTVGSDSPSGGPSSLINPTASGSSIIAIFHSQGTSAFSKVTSQTSENTASASPAINSTSESSANQIPSGFISSGANIPPPSTVQVTATVISVQTSTIQVTPLPQGPDIIVGSNIYPFDTITRTITQSTGGNIIIGPTEVVCGTVTIPLEATGTVPQALSCQGAMVTASPSPNYGNFSALANEVNVMMDNDEFVLLPFPFTIPRILPSASTVQQVRMSPSGVIIAGANMPIPSTLKGQTDLGGGIAAKPGGPEKRKKPGSSCKGLFGAIGCLVNTAKDTVEGAEGIVKDTEPFVKGTVDTVDHAAITNKLNLLDGTAQDFAHTVNALTDEFPSDFGNDLKSLDGKFKNGPPDVGSLLKNAWLEARHLSNVVNAAKNLLDGLKKGGPPELTKDVAKQLRDLLDPSVANPKGGLGLKIPDLSALSELEPVDDLATPTASNPQSSLATSVPSTTFSTGAGTFTSLQASTAQQSSLLSSGSTQQTTTRSTTTTSSSSTSSSSQSASATSQSYFIIAKSGTAYDDFKKFASELDDTAGYFPPREITYWPYYSTTLTIEKASELNNTEVYPLVDKVFVDKPGSGNGDRQLTAVIPNRGRNEPRAPPTNQDAYPANPSLSERQWILPDRNINHLNMISQQSPGPVPGAYIFDPSLGKGTTIYIIDSGYSQGDATDEFALDDSDIHGREPIRKYVVPNHLTLQGIPSNLHAPEDMEDYGGFDGVFYKGHGTRVGSVAGGLSAGVASQAELVFVKTINAIKNPDPTSRNQFILQELKGQALFHAFNWAIMDVMAKGRQGKAVINLSMSVTPLDVYFDEIDYVMGKALESCNLNDIALVVGAGNDGNPSAGDMDEFFPLHRNAVTLHGTSDNNLITVGGVEEDGTLAISTSPQIPNAGGSMTLYAPYRATCATRLKSIPGSAFAGVGGTSFSAGQVSGLAAYFMSLDAVAAQQPGGRFTATGIKQYLVRHSRALHPSGQSITDSNKQKLVYMSNLVPGNLNAAYNRAPEGICAIRAQKRSVGAQANLRRANAPQTSQSDVPTATISGLPSLNATEVLIMSSGHFIGTAFDYGDFGLACTPTSAILSSVLISTMSSSQTSLGSFTKSIVTSSSSVSSVPSSNLSSAFSAFQSSKQFSDLFTTLPVSAVTASTSSSAAETSKSSTTDASFSAYQETSDLFTGSMSSASAAGSSSAAQKTSDFFTSLLISSSSIAAAYSSALQISSVLTTSTPTATPTAALTAASSNFSTAVLLSDPTTSPIAPSTSSPAPTPTGQPPEGPLVCNDNTMSTCQGGSVQPDYVDQAASDICTSLQNTWMFTHSVRQNSPEAYGGVSYEFFVEWAMGCELETQHQFNADLSVCKDMFKATVFDCKDNQGSGGNHTEGCVRFGFQPFCMDPPPSPSPTPTTSPDSAPTPPPAPQPTEGALICNPTPWKCTDGDIQESYIDKTIALWKKDIDKKLQVLSPEPKHSRAFTSYTDGYSNAMYVFNANWTDGCTAEPSHDVYGGDFEGILKSLWKDCTGNGGAGGTRTEGCASYGFEPYCEGYFD